MKTIKITADNKISIIDVDFDNYKAIQKVIGGYIETVKTQKMFDYFGRPVLMLVDEDEYEKQLSGNAVGSFMYDFEKYGLPILGDIIFAQPAGMYGEDMEGIGEPEETMQMLMQRFSFLETVQKGW